MISQAEAEDLARKHLQEYVNACNCNTTEDVGNVLMKLVSVAGIAMIAVEGHETAVSRLVGTAEYIARPEHAKVWNMERAN